MTFTGRWVGSSISTPKSKERGPSPVGRQRHYGAVELAGAGEQVNVNDVVEVARDSNQQPGLAQVGSRNLLTVTLAPCAVQVLSMWEDTFTGVFKFRGRWLVHASGLPKDAFARLRAARRTFTDGEEGGSASSTVESKPSQEADEIEDEVFLTAKREDIDVRRIVKPITLSVSTTSGKAPPERKDTSGPRLTHAFEDPSGDFVPVERTDPVIKRARVRHEEAVARAAMLADEAAAAKSGKPVSQSSGWLLPKRKSPASCAAGARGGGPGRTVTATSVRDSESEGESDSESGPEEPPKSDDTEWEQDDEDDASDEDDSDSTDADYQLADAPPRKSARRKKPLSQESNGSRDGEAKPSGVDATQSPEPNASCTRAASPAGHGPFRKRPRRLAVPPVAGEPALSLRQEETRDSPSSCAGAASSLSAERRDDRPVRARKASVGGRGRTPSPATLSLMNPSREPAAPPNDRPSIAGKRKRGRPAKATAVGEPEESDFPPRHTLVGGDHQADIPDLLSAKDRKKATVPPPAGTGAKMVWRSIRNWDPPSRGMLSTYLHAAKKVVQNKQSSPGVTVHVRLGGDTKNGGRPGNNSDSYAVWAVTAGRSRNSPGAVRVACSELAQTEVPMSAIQRVQQSEEEALAALVKARCTLDDFEPALNVLASEEASPESIEPWTLHQVRTLEQALEKGFDLDRRMHGWAREGMDMDREDFIDLADVSRQIPGKTPTQVLSFYYRYLAAAEPLTDVVYGAEAAEARKHEAILPAHGNQIPSEANGDANLRPVGKHPRTVSPVVHGGSGPPTGPLSKLPTASQQPKFHGRGYSGAREDVKPEQETLAQRGHSSMSPFMRSSGLPSRGPASAAAAFSRRPSAAIDDGGGGGGYERRRGPRAVPADVEVLEVDDSDDAAETDGAARRSASGYPVPDPTAAARSSLSGASTHSRHQAAQSWGSRQVHPRPGAGGAMAAHDPRHHLQRAVHPAPGGNPPASYDYRAEAALARHSHGDRVVSDDGRDRPLPANRGPGGSYPGYEGHSEAPVDHDTFGFMAPCWRLLERAHAYMDQDQLLYMRGLILKHVQKPMTRDQLLERAESCLQEQEKIFAAFVKMFDRIISSNAPPQPSPTVASMSYRSANARVPPTAVPVPVDPRGRSSAYPQASGPRAFAMPAGAAPMRAYPRGGVAGSDTRRQQPAPAYPMGWDGGAGSRMGRAYPSGGGGGGGEAAPPPRLQHAAPYPPPGRDEGRLPSMTYREDGRDRRDFARAWPQHPPSREWRRDGDYYPSSSAAAPPAEAQNSGRRIPGWGHGRTGGWS
ncbi:unnamed protein product [Scytosiphon promiscuus]